jgi:hypothetical protein
MKSSIYTSEQEDFLRNIKKVTKKYVSILIDGKYQPLVHNFWTWTEIKSSLSMREEWEVDLALTPFYGNWNFLYCLNVDSGEIVSIDDDRDVRCTWPNMQVFLKSFSTEEVVYEIVDNNAQFVEVKLKF